MQYLPDEWQFSFFRGKLAAKMGTAALHVLHLMAQACHMANKYKAGQTEPLYRLHASRLKLLSSGSTPAHVIAAHPFLPETPALLEGASEQEVVYESPLTLLKCCPFLHESHALQT